MSIGFSNKVACYFAASGGRTDDKKNVEFVANVDDRVENYVGIGSFRGGNSRYHTGKMNVFY